MDTTNLGGHATKLPLARELSPSKLPRGSNNSLLYPPHPRAQRANCRPNGASISQPRVSDSGSATLGKSAPKSIHLLPACGERVGERGYPPFQPGEPTRASLDLNHTPRPYLRESPFRNATFDPTTVGLPRRGSCQRTSALHQLTNTLSKPCQHNSHGRAQQ